MPARKLHVPTPDPVADLRAMIADMTPAQAKAFALTLQGDDLDLFERLSLEVADPHGYNAYEQLGYEPICVPRVTMALELGYEHPLDAEADGAEIPAMCGRCPAEQFDAAREFDVFFGGAAGGSKTLSMIMLFIRYAWRWPGWRALFVRETYDELDENVFPELRKIGYAEEIGGRWKAGRHELNFHGRNHDGLPESAIRFRYLAKLDDVGRRQGGSYNAVGIDERTKLPPGVAGALLDRIRTAMPGVPVLGMRSTGNPGGRAHGELKRDYVTATDKGAKTLTVELPDSDDTITRRYIPAKATDNPYLDKSYFTRTLAAIPDPQRRRAMRDGDWDVFAGQFFEEWNSDRHVVPADAIELAASWKRYEGIDYGRSAPFCMLRAAIDNDGRAWVCSELYKSGLDEQEQAVLIIADEQAKDPGLKISRAGDPSMWAKVSSAKSIEQVYREHGVLMVKASNDRVNGWARVHQFLAEGPACQYHAGLGWDTCPRLHVFAGAAPNLVRTIGDLPRDKNNPEDLDTDSEDHAADAIRYLLIHAKPMTASVSKPTGPAGKPAPSARAGTRAPVRLAGPGWATRRR